MTESKAVVSTAGRPRKKLVEKFAGKYGLEPTKMMATLKATAFKQKGRQPLEITNEQMAALIVVADQYNLNPWTKELYAYPDQGGIVPVVGVDGWLRIINEHPQLDGIEFRYAEKLVENGEHKPAPEWIECIIHRKDRAQPITVREYFDECYRPPFKPGMKGPWQTHTRRMMRHKALIQAARVAFSFTGIHDQDEAERIIEAEYERVEVPAGATTTDKVKATLGIAEPVSIPYDSSQPITYEVEPTIAEAAAEAVETENEEQPESRQESAQ